MILKNACFASIFLVPLQHIQDVLRVWAAAQQISSKLGSAFTLHHTCHCQKRNGVLLMEKRHVATRETACCSETDRVMTKGAKIGALDERSNL